MRHLLLRVCLGTGAVGLALVLGCNHGQRPCRCCSNKPCCGGDGPVVPAPSDPNVLAAARRGAPDTLPPYMVKAATPPATQPPPAPPLPPPVTESCVRQVGYAEPLRGGKEEVVKRRTFTDITANPAFGHAPDYSWLVGELQFLHVRNVWKVRYASLEDEDRYGGSVTLVDAGTMTGFKDGQLVRVEGQMVNPDARGACPPYRVRSIQPVR